MALPPAIQTCVVSFGPFLTFTGVPFSGRVTFTASRGVVWTATGTPVLPSAERITLDENGMGQITLPLTSQDGFSDGAGNAVKDWTYRAAIDLEGRTTDTRTFQVPTTAPMDLDLTTPVPSSQGIVVALPTVMEVDGATGIVNTDAITAARVGDFATATGAAVAVMASGARASIGAPLGTRPQFTRLSDEPVLTAAAMGTASIFWPSVLRVDHVRPSFGSRYVMFVSTDHDAGAGGIYMAESDDLLTWALTTRVPNGRVYVDAIGTQTETPSVWYDANTDEFCMLYQQQGTIPGRVAGQVTLLATSPDLLNWTRQGIAIDFDTSSDFISTEGHTGYARVTQLGGSYMAHHLATGGVYFRRGVSYSVDGRRWAMDFRLIEHDPHLASDVNRAVICSEVFRWRDEWWGIGEDRSLTWDTGDRFMIVGRVDAELRTFVDPPAAVLDMSLDWESGAHLSSHVFVDDGRLYLFYQQGNNIGLAVAGGVS